MTPKKKSFDPFMAIAVIGVVIFMAPIGAQIAGWHLLLNQQFHNINWHRCHGTDMILLDVTKLIILELDLVPLMNGGILFLELFVVDFSQVRMFGLTD